MWFAYMDESKENNEFFVYSALVMNGDKWPVDVNERVIIFRKVMRFVTNCRFFRIMSSANANEFLAFERLINRLNRTAEKKGGHHVLLFCDAGQEATFTKRIRKMRVYNPIWSSRGVWEDTGQETRNIPISQMIEDPIFKDSKASYFIQLVDFCAYALLRSERPIGSRTALGYDQMYDMLQPVTVPVNNRNDPRGLGIIR